MRYALVSLIAMACVVVACRTKETSGVQVGRDAPDKTVDPSRVPTGSATYTPTKHVSNIVGNGGSGGAGGADPSDTESTTDAMSASSASSSSGGAAPSPGNPEYVTDLLIYAACEVDGMDVPLANGHAGPSECEHIVLTPAHNDDGDFYEVWGYFNWTTNDPRITVECFNGEHDNFCWPVGHADLFDATPSVEPMAVITACAVNDCPVPRPADCADQLCISFTADSVVNVEGVWSLSGDTFTAGDQMSPLQDARSFGDDQVGVKRGNVNGDQVSFEIDDYGYRGTFAGDRDHLSGTVIELMTLSTVGSWSAERISH